MKLSPVSKPSHRPLRLTPLSACFALAFPILSSGALAQSTVEGSGDYAIAADAFAYSQVIPKSGNFALPATVGPTSSGAYGAPLNRWDASASVGVSSFGDGRFGSAARTLESYGSMTPMSTHVNAVFRDTLVNTSSVAQQASFALNIKSLDFSFDYGTRFGTNSASFTASVYLDGSNTLLWSSSFSYDNGLPSYSATGLGTVTSSGADLGLVAALPSGCGQCAFYSGGFGISNYQTTIALGSVGAGQSIGIHYEVDLTTETNMYGGDASVVFNDPSLLSSADPATARLAFDVSDAPDVPNVSAVPEPETYLMMAAGLGVLAVARRRRGR